MSAQSELIQEIIDRASAAASDKVQEQWNEQRVRQLVEDCLKDLAKDEEFVRKLRFAGGDNRLIGSKFARWGLTAADIEFLYDLQNSLRGQRRIDAGTYPGPSPELERAFQEISAARYLSEDEIREIDRQALDNLWPRVPRDLVRGLTREQWLQRAMDTAESGYGAELVGAQYVGELWAAARPDSRVFALIPSFEMTAPIAYLPVEADIPEMLWVSESTTSNAAAYPTVLTGSQRVQVRAYKFLIHQMWSGELEEDSIIPFVPFLRRQAAVSLAYHADSAILNGDTTNAATGNINLVDADPPDTKHYLAFDGIRHAALVDNPGNAYSVGAISDLTPLRTAKGLMIDRARLMDWGHPTNPEDLVYICDPQTADLIATMDNVVNWRIQAGTPLLSGEVARIIGHPVISSIAVQLANTAGMVSATPANNTTGSIVAFNRRGFVVGWRRRVKLETERLPATDQTRLVYSLRLGFGRFTPTGSPSAIEAAAVGYNVTLP